jgi:serine/threonine-protein kinase RsbW
MTIAVTNQQALPGPTEGRCDRVFEGRADQIREARTFLAAVLNGHPAVDDAVMCLSELASNAILHSRSGRPGGHFTVHTEICRGRLRVEIGDDGGAWTQSTDPEEQHGRGLLIVGQLALAWGRGGDHETGWTVWFELDSPCSEGARQSPAGETGQRWIISLDGQRLRQLRRKHGLSQAGLAGRAGVSVSVISRLERHACGSCRSRTLARLAAALGEEPTVLASQPDSTDRIQPP